MEPVTAYDYSADITQQQQQIEEEEEIVGETTQYLPGERGSLEDDVNKKILKSDNMFDQQNITTTTSTTNNESSHSSSSSSTSSPSVSPTQDMLMSGGSAITSSTDSHMPSHDHVSTLDSSNDSVSMPTVKLSASYELMMKNASSNNNNNSNSGSNKPKLFVGNGGSVFVPINKPQLTQSQTTQTTQTQTTQTSKPATGSGSPFQSPALTSENDAESPVQLSSNIFENLGFVIDQSINLKRKMDLVKIIKRNGGKSCYSCGAKSTHLITTPQGFVDNTAKVQQALALGIPIVVKEFVHHCAYKKQLLEVEPYRITATSIPSESLSNPNSPASSYQASPTFTSTTNQSRDQMVTGGGSSSSSSSPDPIMVPVVVPPIELSTHQQQQQKQPQQYNQPQQQPHHQQPHHQQQQPLIKPSINIPSVYSNNGVDQRHSYLGSVSYGHHAQDEMDEEDIGKSPSKSIIEDNINKILHTFDDTSSEPVQQQQQESMVGLTRFTEFEGTFEEQELGGSIEDEEMLPQVDFRDALPDSLSLASHVATSPRFSKESHLSDPKVDSSETSNYNFGAITKKSASAPTSTTTTATATNASATSSDDDMLSSPLYSNYHHEIFNQILSPSSNELNMNNNNTFHGIPVTVSKNVVEQDSPSKIFVGGLSFSDLDIYTEKESLQKQRMYHLISLFKEFGKIVKIQEFLEEQHIFITFDKETEAKLALQTLKSMSTKTYFTDKIKKNLQTLGLPTIIAPSNEFFVRKSKPSQLSNSANNIAGNNNNNNSTNNNNGTTNNTDSKGELVGDNAKDNNNNNNTLATSTSNNNSKSFKQPSHSSSGNTAKLRTKRKHLPARVYYDDDEEDETAQYDEEDGDDEDDQDDESEYSVSEISEVDDLPVKYQKTARSPSSSMSSTTFSHHSSGSNSNSNSSGANPKKKKKRDFLPPLSVVVQIIVTFIILSAFFMSLPQQ
ncbi:hypothetical protein SAMD00019534_099200 [Acytostelium subglobosum LB1]|uniref:hypothetical protein n=1 Tax=Acytostelium subglobosum LB1 TaxID=1410327 RepID=UPI000644B5C4|nr:hypothetical protein SAMD00019534_099200 [Acytostelium subglobosum LB1]GAM26745.1 hypothetical protein SAMD00019534_099200 [Acytostelium subglobosum LB1]|eukprot:XP_012750406.1 hypothetical protein SAMD00019534_099200 [Acytostelium subglobosum LB1]